MWATQALPGRYAPRIAISNDHHLDHLHGPWKSREPGHGVANVGPSAPVASTSPIPSRPDQPNTVTAILSLEG